MQIAVDCCQHEMCTSTTGAGRNLFRGPGRLAALKIRTMPPITSTYGLSARAKTPNIAMLVIAGLAVISAAPQTPLLQGICLSMALIRTGQYHWVVCEYERHARACIMSLYWSMWQGDLCMKCPGIMHGCWDSHLKPVEATPTVVLGLVMIR